METDPVPSMDTNEAFLADSCLSDSRIDFTVGPEESGVRLDQYLSHVLPQISRSTIGAAIRKGMVTVDGIGRKNSYRVKSGELIVGTIEKPAGLHDVHPMKVDFSVLFEDEHLLVISKPPGIVVHPGNGNYSATLVHGLLFHCRSIAEAGDAARPGIVHRLDKDTSGIMLVAKTDKVHQKLVECFKHRLMTKQYLALVHGQPAQLTGRISAPIGRHPVHRTKMAVREKTGKHAASTWELIERIDNKYSLLKVTIETGRTHQIRVHLAHLGCPVAGDTVYGASRDNRIFPRQLLHAWRLAFVHPVTAEAMDLAAPVWEDFSSALEKIGLVNIS